MRNGMFLSTVVAMLSSTTPALHQLGASSQGPVSASQDLATSEEHPALLPPHPAVRARARIIMDPFNAHFVPLFYRILVR